MELPLFSCKYAKPVDGWPPKINMDKFAESIFHGFEKDREPLEIQLTPSLAPGERLFQGAVGVSKGFLRISIILYEGGPHQHDRAGEGVFHRVFLPANNI